MTSISGNMLDIVNRKIVKGTVQIQNGKIATIQESPIETSDPYILPGFIDAHIHIESSMLVPSEFARLAVRHGTVATVSDPHEIGNVLGVEGIRYMIKNGKQVPFKFYFGASSCVPATPYETAGAVITKDDLQVLFEKDGLKYLSEMMNYPGVLARDPLVMDKIKVAQKLGKPVDGHAPGLKGKEAECYISAGISTDHECFTLEEALDKIKYGMKILIREGSAAKNYEALHSLIQTHGDHVMFCSDDKHPHELVDGHINLLVKRSVISKGYDLFDVLRCATLNPILHYGLDVGLLRRGDPADFIIVDNLSEFNVKETYIQGNLVAKDLQTLIPRVKAGVVNHFAIGQKKPHDFAVESKASYIQVIEALDNELITKKSVQPATIRDDYVISDVKHDILKMVVVNRYFDAKPAVGFIKNFGISKGALASCIAHDSHNIIAVGVRDEDICEAVNAIIQEKGGISIFYDEKTHILPLPIAGIMTGEDGFLIAKRYAELDALAKSLGTKLYAPFMTLSFMALLVIPSLKLSDKGLFNVEAFNFTELEPMIVF